MMRIPPKRRLICDLLHFAKKIPTVPAERVMDLGRVAELRAACPARPNWVALLAKAFSLVAREIPELRWSYIPFPYPRIIQHEHSIANIAVDREPDGLLFAKLREPSLQPLETLSKHLQRFKTTPVWELSDFRQALRLSRYPKPARRFLWWLALNTSARRRAKHMGTFGISSVAGLGTSLLHPICPLSYLLTYGPLDGQGSMAVRIIFDHRIVDGATVARALARIEEVLCGAIAEELSGLHTKAA